ncbi:MAG: helicase C-terminal domain-containing protein, partial [Gemmatimonadota bacterium]
LTVDAARAIREEVARAHGNEVCFIAEVEESGTIPSVRAVARGHGTAVLAAVREAEAGDLVIHNHPSGDLTPSEADLRIAADLYASSIGLAITDSEARELYVVVEPPSARTLELLDEDEVDRILAPGGPVAAAHPNYEDRPGQREMAGSVVRAYNGGGIALVEAGTGTGKSIAYLVPALLWAARNRERTLVSTNTINLQEQLVAKDLPFLRRSLEVPFRFALVKGRHNYISIRRLRLALETAPVLFEDENRRELDAIAEWSGTTRDGSLQDLAFAPVEEVWDEVVSDSDVCLRARCPHFEACFYQRARRDAASADVLVINHHLLFSDVAVRRGQENWTGPAVLPPYRRIVLDEAHNLEDAATAHLGVSLTRRSLLRVLGRLDRRGRGILSAFEDRLAASDGDLLEREALDFIAALRPRVDRAREQVIEFFGHLETLCGRAEDGVARLGDDFTGDPAWTQGAAASLESTLLLLEELGRDLGRLRERILIDERRAETLAESLVELSGVRARIQDAAAGLRLALQPGTDPVPMVRWLERRGTGREPNVAVRASPVDLAEALRDGLFERLDTAVLTSATLTTRDGFAFLRSRLGLGGGLRVAESVHASPFDFETQTRVAVVTDLPAPDAADGPRLEAAIAGVTEDMARLSDGGIFVLFTSYRSMRAVAGALRSRGTEGRWPLFVQGEASRARLLDRFVDSGRGLLLGVASFWEGVDVPGDPLRGLIIARLPFKVPTEPLTAARLEAIEVAGGNAFLEYMLPLAALRLKQGFGRLIRSRADRGAVVILDRRAGERGYGRFLLESLPAPAGLGPWPVVRERLRAFYLREPERPGSFERPVAGTGDS